MKTFIKSMAILLISANIFLVLPTHAQTNDFAIIPQATGDVGAAVNDVGLVGGKVRDNYNKQANTLKNDLGAQMASGIMTWNTLLDYVVYVVRFLSQIGLLIGAVMIIYAGYMYATEIFGGEPSKGKKAITNAIVGVLVISFSYAIMKILTSAFLS